MIDHEFNLALFVGGLPLSDRDATIADDRPFLTNRVMRAKPELRC